MQTRTRFLALAFGASLLAAATPLLAKPAQRLTAFAVDMSHAPGLPSERTRATTLDLTIDRWSTPAERDTLRAALQEGGADALLKALQKSKEVGRIAAPGNIGYPLRFAWQAQLPDGGRRVIIATDRPIGFFEAANNPRSIEYPFLLVDLRLNEKGEGQGKLLPLAKITADRDHLVEIENYASEPVRLTQVRVVR